MSDTEKKDDEKPASAKSGKSGKKKKKKGKQMVHGKVYLVCLKLLWSSVV